MAKFIQVKVLEPCEMSIILNTQYIVKVYEADAYRSSYIVYQIGEHIEKLMVDEAYNDLLSILTGDEIIKVRHLNSLEVRRG